MSRQTTDAFDAVVVGAGLAGLVATSELAAAGRRVLLLDQEPEQSLGGQAFWSFGGLFLVDSKEQRRLRVRDSLELARLDWMRSAGFDREPDAPLGRDHWAQRWALAYLEFAAGEKRVWLAELGLKLFPIVGWAERGALVPGGHGNSVPRFHIVWGTGPAVVAPFARRVAAASHRGQVRLAFRHRVDELVVSRGRVVGVRGAVLEPSRVPRGGESSRTQTGAFEFSAGAVIVCSGGIGGSPQLIRESWPERLGQAPAAMLTGVPSHVDGRMLGICRRARARLVNLDRMWHYTEGVANWAPVWPGHGVRVLAGPSGLWLDRFGRRLPPPNFPGFDNLAALEAIGAAGGRSWLLLNRRILAREVALSGSEQNPDLTGRSWRLVLGRQRSAAAGPVADFLRFGSDFVTGASVAELVAAMNRLSPGIPLDAAGIGEEIARRDRGFDAGDDPQLAAIEDSRRYLGDRLLRVAPPHRLLDPGAGPLVAVRLRPLSRKTLGGLQTDLGSRVLGDDGSPLPGLYAAGEAAGFGGGGMHGYRALEGSFLGGCLLSGRVAGREAARELS